jgi:hypothetical protein
LQPYSKTDTFLNSGGRKNHFAQNFKELLSLIFNSNPIAVFVNQKVGPKR